MKIRIEWPKGQVTAEIHDSPTAEQFANGLPCTSRANTWGDEVYFHIPVSAKLEPDAAQVVDPGTVCFWVEGHSLAIPFGPTPISEKGECRLVTKVNVIGKVLDDPRVLKSIRDGDSVTVTLEKRGGSPAGVIRDRTRSRDISSGKGKKSRSRDRNA